MDVIITILESGKINPHKQMYKTQDRPKPLTKDGCYVCKHQYTKKKPCYHEKNTLGQADTWLLCVNVRDL